jgi:hypothetical protein
LTFGTRDDLARGALDHRVDQGRAVALVHRVGVDRTQRGDPIHISHRLARRAHGRPGRAWKQIGVAFFAIGLGLSAAANLVG